VQAMHPGAVRPSRPQTSVGVASGRLGRSIAKVGVFLGGLIAAQVFGQVPAPAAGPINPVEMLARQVGASRCADMARRVGDQVVGASPSAGVVLAPSGSTDQALISASIETRDAQGMHFVSAFLAPNARNGCDGGYDDIRYWPKVCDQLVIDELRGLSAIHPLGPEIGTLVAGASQRIYLMPAGAGCVSIRKEILF